MDNYYCRFCNFSAKNLNDHEPICELKNNIKNNEKKLLIIPFNKNLNNLDYWKDIIKYFNFLILQKDKKKKSWQFVMDNYFIVPDNNCFYDQFFQYILLYYKKLTNIIIYTRNDWIKNFSNYEDIVSDLNENNILYKKHKSSRKNKYYLKIDEILRTFKNINKFLKIFFDDFKINEKYKFYSDYRSFSVNKKLILYHSLDKWINFFSIYINTKIIELEINIFIDLLFVETSSRLKKDK